jgi:hypothetical protein
VEREPDVSAPARLGLAGGTFFLLGGAPSAIAAILLTGIPSLLAALLTARSSARLRQGGAGSFARVTGHVSEPRFLDL